MLIETVASLQSSEDCSFLFKQEINFVEQKLETLFLQVIEAEMSVKFFQLPLGCL